MISLYYWRARSNFGDSLAPLLLKKFTKRDSVWAEPEQANLVLTGSVLDKLPSDWFGVVAGAGKLHEATRLTLPHARILAVRGPLSAKGLKGDFVLGDPGLLADELVGPQEKQYNLGLVPHWTDTALAQNPVFLRYNPKIIDVTGDPLEVIRQIGQCKKIVSSSLHGIIVADAFGIPRRIEMAPSMLANPAREGGSFKWADYLGSLGLTLDIGVTKEVDRETVIEKQHELWDVLNEIRSIFT